MLKIVNIVLIFMIIILSIYSIVVNNKLYNLHNKIIKIKFNQQKIRAINNKYLNEFYKKNSNIYINNYAKYRLKMTVPKKIYYIKSD